MSTPKFEEALTALCRNQAMRHIRAAHQAEVEKARSETWRKAFELVCDDYQKLYLSFDPSATRFERGFCQGGYHALDALRLKFAQRAAACVQAPKEKF